MLKLQLVKGEHQISGRENPIGGFTYGNNTGYGLNQILSGGILQHDPELMFTGFFFGKTQPAGHAATGMGYGKLPGIDAVERADNREFGLVILCKITKCKDFCFHSVFVQVNHSLLLAVLFGNIPDRLKVCNMQYKAVIFDMDGVLIDSEPLWQEAGIETLSRFGINLTLEQYHTSTGLRTEEWVAHWFRQYNIPGENAQDAIDTIIRKAISKIGAQGMAMPGAAELVRFFRQKQIRTGLATSSPMALVDVVVDKLQLRPFFDTLTSAEKLEFGKPHPQVFLNCAAELGVLPEDCIVFEDSFNGMIAAKAAKMKCVVVPAAGQYSLPKWAAADMKLTSLTAFIKKTE